MANGATIQSDFDATHRSPDGAYASVPAGGRYAQPGELAEEPAMHWLRVLCAAWGEVQPALTDPVVERNAAEVPSTIGNAG